MIPFLENKGNKNDLFFGEEKDKIFFEIKVISQNGKEDLRQ